MKGRKGSDRRGRRALAAADPLAGPDPPGHAWSRRSPAAIDLYPTLIDLAGIARVGDKPFDGISLAPLAPRQDGAAPDRVLFQHWAGKVSARDQRFRLDAAGRLFDLVDDPGQAKTSRPTHPDVTKRLVRRGRSLEARRAGPRCPNRRPALPGRIPGLPADRAAGPRRRPARRRQRARRAPNCSFFTDWRRRTTGYLGVEVNDPGRYEAIIHYTCPGADVGSEWSWPSARRDGSEPSREPFDPPLRGRDTTASHGKGSPTSRTSGPSRWGVVELPAGRGELSLLATKVAGRQIADVRALELVLMPESRPQARREGAE